MRSRLLAQRSHMKRIRLTGEIGARVPGEMKRDLEQIAQQRLISPSDVLREAVIMYLKAHKARSPKQAQPSTN